MDRGLLAFDSNLLNNNTIIRDRIFVPLPSKYLSLLPISQLFWNVLMTLMILLMALKRKKKNGNLFDLNCEYDNW